MPLFTIYALDVPDSGPLRAAHGEQHRDRLRNAAGPVRVVVAGPLRNDDDAPIGSLLIVEAEAADIVREFVEADPYRINAIYDTVDIRPFAVSIGTIGTG
ncbi:MAG: YciI family protein [Alphaproteobacteria bacterium]